MNSHEFTKLHWMPATSKSKPSVLGRRPVALSRASASTAMPGPVLLPPNSNLPRKSRMSALCIVLSSVIICVYLILFGYFQSVSTLKYWNSELASPNSDRHNSRTIPFLVDSQNLTGLACSEDGACHITPLPFWPCKPLSTLEHIRRARHQSARSSWPHPWGKVMTSRWACIQYLP